MAAWHGGAGCMNSASSHSGRGELLLKVRSSVIMRSVSFPLYTKHVRTTRVGTGSECLPACGALPHGGKSGRCAHHAFALIQCEAILKIIIVVDLAIICGARRTLEVPAILICYNLRLLVLVKA